MTPLFVFCADLHLEDGAWSTRPSIYGDAYYSFQQIVDYCILHKLPLVLGGDVLERKSNSARPILKLCIELSRMESAQVPVFYIQGNHEYDRHAPWLSVHPWPQHIHNQTVDINGTAVFGLDWLPKGEIQAALQAVPSTTDILIVHQVWKDFMGNIGRTECELCDVHHVQTVLAGDFHVTKVVSGVNAQQHPVKMLSPGSTAMQDISEAPEKFFFVIGRADTEFAFHPEPLRTRELLRYEVCTAETLDDLCAGTLAADIAAAKTRAETAAADIRKPLVRIKFNKQLPDAYLRLLTAISDDAHVFCDALAEKTKPASSTGNSGVRGSINTVLTALEDLLGADTEEYRLAAKLVQSADPSRELDERYRSYIAQLEEVANAVTAFKCEELGAPS